VREANIAASTAAGARRNPPGLPSRRSLILGLLPLAADGQKLEREVGITTSSLTGHVAVKPGGARIALLDLPRFLRQELDMRVIDFNTRTIAGATTRELEALRKNAAEAGCVLTNLKLNHIGLALDSTDSAARLTSPNPRVGSGAGSELPVRAEGKPGSTRSPSLSHSPPRRMCVAGRLGLDGDTLAFRTVCATGSHLAS
jgi:hypothetical protein